MKNFDDRVVLLLVLDDWQMRFVVSFSAFDGCFLSGLINIRQHTVALIQRCDICEALWTVYRQTIITTAMQLLLCLLMVSLDRSFLRVQYKVTLAHA